MVGVQRDLGSHVVRGVSVRRHRAGINMFDVGQEERMDEGESGDVSGDICTS